MCKRAQNMEPLTAYIKGLGRAGRKPCFDDIMPTMYHVLMTILPCFQGTEPNKKSTQPVYRAGTCIITLALLQFNSPITDQQRRAEQTQTLIRYLP